MSGHRDLRVWQEAMQLAKDVYGATRSFPRSEIYGLTSQLNRAAVSVPSNIAEGYGRGGKDYERFVGMAYGSLPELETQLELARQLGLVEPGIADDVLKRIAMTGRMLNALRQGLRRSRRPEP
jgi:four helix bundle protein